MDYIDQKDTLRQAILNVVLVLVLWFFMQRNGLLTRYGLCKAKAPASRFLWYLPLMVLSTQNLWFGISTNYPAVGTGCRLVCMPCVGFLEELVFRGFLFRGIARDNVREAIVISSITFGLGHIINLLNGSGMGLVENLC